MEESVWSLHTFFHFSTVLVAPIPWQFNFKTSSIHFLLVHSRPLGLTRFGKVSMPIKVQNNSTHTVHNILYYQRFVFTYISINSTMVQNCW